MSSVLLSALPQLSNAQKTLLKKGNYLTVSDIVLASPDDIARKCKVSPPEIKNIVQLATRDSLNNIRPLEEIVHEGDEKFTTGDAYLDDALGGGIRTRMIWEIVGESSAGKTQLALQLALLVQLPSRLGGLSGSTCYLTTSSKLPTTRLHEILEAHPLLSHSLSSLAHIHTISTNTIPTLAHVLTATLPPFIERNMTDPESKPIKLLVIDALAELFHLSDKTTTKSLVQRSQDIVEISSLLHSIASKWNLAVLVLNEVVDVFHRGGDLDATDDNLVYSEQARWFGRSDSVPGQDAKEASLGLVWANQVNARILLSRTGRRRYIDEPQINKRRRRTEDSETTPAEQTFDDNQSTLIRRMSIIFNCAAAPCSLDYIVTAAAISIIPEDDATLPRVPLTTPVLLPVSASATDHPCPDLSSQISPLDVGCVEDGSNTIPGSSGHEDEWDRYWTSDEISEDIYNSIIFDAEGDGGQSTEERLIVGVD